MATSISFRVLFSALLVLLTASMARGQDVETGQEIDEPALLAKDLAAFQAFRSLIAARPYELSEDRLLGMVKEYLRKTNDKLTPDGKPHRADEHPRKLPTVSDLQESLLDTDFQARYRKMIQKATSGLDPDGKLRLEKRLADYLEQHDKLRSNAQKRYEDYVQKKLPATLLAVNKKLVAKQIVQLNLALGRYLKSDKLTTRRIESVIHGKEQSDLSRAIGKEILRQVDLDLPRLLPADEAFGKSVNNVVSDGVGQLKEQQGSLKVQDPKSRTLEGIKSELNARLVAETAKQEKHRRDNPLLKHYGTFPSVKDHIVVEAGQHFDRRIAAAAEQIGRAVRRGTQAIPKEHEQAIHDRTVHDLPKHHRIDPSRALLGPVIRTMVGVDRQWVSDFLKQEAMQNPSQYDSGYSPDRLKKDVDDLLARNGSKAQESWNTLRDLLIKEYEEKLLPKVRDGISKQQALQYSPQLAKHEWRPGERDILNLAGKLQSQQLHALNVWLKIPATDDVLEETWQLWLVSAKNSLAIGQRAVFGQERIVQAEKAYIFARIRKDMGKGKGHWVNEYVSHVSDRWKRSPDSATGDYPGLFSITREKIVGLVASLFKQVEQEKKEAEKVEAERRAALKKRETKLPAESGTADQKQTPREPRFQGRGSGQMGATGSGGTKPLEDTLDRNNERAKILKAQNQLADRLEPEIKAKIEKSQVTKETLETNYWKDAYIQRMTVIWEQDRLSKDSPKIMSPVVDRIENKVIDILAPIRKSTMDVVRIHQNEIVEQHCAGKHGKESIVELARQDPDVTWDPDIAQAKYSKLLFDRASSQWQSNPSPEIGRLRGMYPKLLPSVEKLIAEIVADAIASNQDAPIAEEVARPNSWHPVGDGDGFGEGDSPYGFYYKFYRIGFWTLLLLVIVITACWYWHIMYLRAYIASQRLHQ